MRGNAWIPHRESLHYPVPHKTRHSKDYQFNSTAYLKSKQLPLVNLLTAGVAYIRVFIFYSHIIKYHILNMLKIKCDINQQDLKRVDLHFVKSE